MALLLPIVFIVGGIILLITGAEALIRGAGSIAKKLAVPEIVIGLTVVALGTSAPELVINTLAAYRGQHAIVFGNIIGSNLANILLILGVAGLVRPLSVLRNTVWKEIPFVLLATGVMLALVYDSWHGGVGDGQLSRIDGLVLLVLFGGFMAYTFALTRTESSTDHDVAVYPGWASALMVVGGMGGLFAGGHLTVEGAIDVARHLGVSEKLIACTIVAVGTSLPELVTSAVAARRGRCDIAVGNVVGSCVFNVLMVLGISALVNPVDYSSAFNVDAGVLMAASLVLFITMFTGRRRMLDRWEAALMLAGYAGYIGYAIYRR